MATIASSPSANWRSASSGSAIGSWRMRTDARTMADRSARAGCSTGSRKSSCRTRPVAVCASARIGMWCVLGTATNSIWIPVAIRATRAFVCDRYRARGGRRDLHRGARVGRVDAREAIGVPRIGVGFVPVYPSYIIPGAESSERDSAVIPAKAGTQRWIPAFGDVIQSSPARPRVWKWVPFKREFACCGITNSPRNPKSSPRPPSDLRGRQAVSEIGIGLHSLSRG